MTRLTWSGSRSRLTSAGKWTDSKGAMTAVDKDDGEADVDASTMAMAKDEQGVSGEA